MTLNFNIENDGLGWGVTVITSIDKTYSFEFSYLNDPVFDLLLALISILKGESIYQEVVFIGEPGENSFVLKHVRDNILQIEVYSAGEWRNLVGVHTKFQKEMVYNDIDTLINFCKLAYIAIDKIINKNSIGFNKLKEFHRLLNNLDGVSN